MFSHVFATKDLKLSQRLDIWTTLDKSLYSAYFETLKMEKLEASLLQQS